ncbi:ABC-2 transporter permease, partial [Staphylococcus warneri]|nr:ABC-2 transporter permease [Staphylococcus warneri]
MKGFLLSIFYTSKKTLISYFIVSIVVTVIFSFLNP